MLNKKAFEAGVLIGIIAMLVVFVVLFRIDTLIAGIITSGAEDQICFWSASLTSFSRAGPTTLMGLQCPKRTVYVMFNSDDIPVAKRAKGVEYVFINKPIPRKVTGNVPSRENLAKWYGVSEADFDMNAGENSKKNVWGYRLDEVMANELKRCWGNLGRGTYDLFDQDLSPIGYKPGAIKDGGSIANYLKLWNLRFNEAPKICHICSEIIFHESVSGKEIFKGERDLEPFLRKNPVKSATPEAMSYYEFLGDDIKQSDFFGPSYTYATDKTQKVVFLRMNVNSYVGEIFGDAISLDPTQMFSDRDYKEKDRIIAIDFPLLIPSDEISGNCDKFD